METIESGEWPPIELAWRQKLAAFWSILWPAMASTWVIVILAFSRLSTAKLERWAPGMNAAAMLISLLGQALFVPRLVRKKYRSFRIVVERMDGTIGGKLSVGEAARVAFPIVSLQVGSLLGGVLFAALAGAYLDERMAGAIGALIVVGWFFVAGPYSMSFAVPAIYRGFRLQAYGQRYV